VLQRIDVWHPHALEAVFASLANLRVRYASLNDHTPGQGQYRDPQRFFVMRERYGDARGEAEVYGPPMARPFRTCIDAWLKPRADWDWYSRRTTTTPSRQSTDSAPSVRPSTSSP
jgi:hypothetical protein